MPTYLKHLKLVLLDHSYSTINLLDIYDYLLFIFYINKLIFKIVKLIIYKFESRNIKNGI